MGLLLLLLLVGIPSSAAGPLSPSQALTAFETEPGFVVEFVAAEPLVASPCALAFDERGRVFVAENRGYPEGMPDSRPAGVIALLEDRNGDGVMDRRHVFASGLRFPNGVMCWRGGVIVTDAPDVLWLADTNGDHQADVREVLLTGFATDKTTQLRVNDPSLGPDGWVYLAGGLNSGKITSSKRPGTAALSLDRNDLRFRPDTGEMELTDGKSQFGLDFDTAGNRFACYNRVQVQHVPLPSRYLNRNPAVRSPGALQDCPELIENKLLPKSSGGASRIFPISANITTADSHEGTYSAACAVTLYRGSSLPAEYLGAAFSCEPTGNLVRGDRLEKAGGTFSAQRIHARTEALRSRDDWFRPVYLTTGPDDALYVADMYRKTIEHPQYLPAEVRKHTDFESGRDLGRIWRLRGTKRTPRPSSSWFSKPPPRRLVDELDSPNQWRRDTAFRLLVERGAHAEVTRLKRALGRERSAAGAVLQLQLLNERRSLDEPILLHALDSRSASVRQNAVRLAEPLLADASRLTRRVLDLAADSDPHVRFQVALTIGTVTNHPRILSRLGQIGSLAGDDRWTHAAVLSSIPKADAMLSFIQHTLTAARRTGSSAEAALLEEAGQVLSMMPQADWPGIAAQVSQLIWPGEFQLSGALALGFARGARNRHPDFLRDNPRLTNLLELARNQAVKTTAQAGVRLRAVELLGFDSSAAAATTLLHALRPENPAELQIAAARALVQPAHASTASKLLERDQWDGFPPALRGTILGGFLSQPALHPALLNALERGSVALSAVNATQREQLKKARDPAVRAQAARIFSTFAGADRQAAFEAAKPALALSPMPANGRAVFHRLCAACHRFNREGIAVGPDLFDIRHQPKESILLHLVIPEAEVAPNFVNYVCETTDGRTLSGLLAAESAASITLRQAQGLEETIPRGQIASVQATVLSMMPQELEKGMSLQELADLLAYLRGEE